MKRNGERLKSKEIKKTIVFTFISLVICMAFLTSIFPLTKASFGFNKFSESQECIKNEFENIVTKVSLQGGSINPANYFLYDNEKIGYLCHADGYYQTCIIQHPLLKSWIESGISEGIRNKIQECYEKDGYEVAIEQGGVNVELLPDKIVADFDYPVTSGKNPLETYDSFEIVLDNNIYELISIGNDILSWEANYGDAETTVYMNSYHNLKVEKKKQSDGTTIYILTDKSSGNKFQFASRSVAWPPGYGFSSINENENKSILGCCYDAQEGICVGKTTQNACETTGGIWNASSDDCEIQQCQQGCCIINGQAFFVSAARCQRLSALNGLNINMWTDMEPEICIRSAAYDVKGACIYDKSCKHTVKSECLSMNREFHEGYLCSSEELRTNCEPTKETTCVEGKDQIYFLDSCGNIANIYDASKTKDKNYWSKIIEPYESCGYGLPNVNSEKCGNCDFFRGSKCETYNRKEDKTKPKYGDNICQDLSCEYEGQKYSHGETWCGESPIAESGLPGSRQYRLMCYDNEVIVEPCADYRQEICIDSEVNSFSTATCRVNRWQDCLSQQDQKACEDSSKRDCHWIVSNESTCVPKFAPGYDFWKANTDSQSICSSASTQCIVKYEYDNDGKKVCVENCECLEDSWKQGKNQVCIALGDCQGRVVI